MTKQHEIEIIDRRIPQRLVWTFIVLLLALLPFAVLATGASWQWGLGTFVYLVALAWWVTPDSDEDGDE